MVDRVIYRLDSFTPGRENEYRHLPCIIVLSFLHPEGRIRQREVVENIHVHIELIGETLIQFHGCV